MVYHQINIESYILYKVHTSERTLYRRGKKARKNRNIFPCLLQCAFFVILYNQLNYLKILFYTICQFYIINELFSNFLLTFTIFYIFPCLNAIIISFVRLRSSASTGICSLSNHSAIASSSVSSVIPSSPSSSQKNPISSVSVKDHG